MAIKTGIVLQTSTNSQASNRVARVFYDQHKLSKFPDVPGRAWWTYVEKPADGMAMAMPVASLTQGGRSQDGRDLHWEAPFYPDMMYADFGRSEYGHFVWQYQRMQSDDARATELFYQASARLAATKGWEMPEPGKPLPYAISVAIGDLPRSPLIAQALRAGNPWLIGETLEPDDDLLPSLLRQWQGRGGWKPAALTTPTDVVTMNAKTLDQLVAEAVAKAMAEREGVDADAKPKTVKKPGKNAAYLAFINGQMADGKTRDQANSAWHEQKTMAGAA